MTIGKRGLAAEPRPRTPLLDRKTIRFQRPVGQSYVNDSSGNEERGGQSQEVA